MGLLSALLILTENREDPQPGPAPITPILYN